MQMKELLVHVDSAPRAAARVALAARLARRRGTRLVGLFAETGTIGPSLVGRRDPRRVAESAGEARAAFERATAEAGLLAAWWQLEAGEYADLVRATAACCRYVDLAIFGQFERESARTPEDLVEQVLLGSGRPVLVVPSAGEHLEVGRRALVVWNSTPEAARALHDALPLLEGAESVAVIALQRSGDAEAASRMPPLDIVAHLGAHGIAAGYERLLADDEDRLLDVLLNRTFDFHADLVVIGAQGLEGVPLLQRPTAARQLLGSMVAPVLLSR